MNGGKDAKALGQLNPDKCVLFICDVQEKFKPSIAHFKTVVDNIRKMLEAANILGMPVVATEQYPNGLGRMVEEISSILPEKTFVKYKFSMMVPDVDARLESLKQEKSVDTVILSGIETHVCIISTCLDLIQRGFTVHVVADAVSSRSQTDRHFALRRMEQQGAHVTTMESVVLNLIGDAKHPNFKQIQSLIKLLPEDTGLIPNSS